MNSTQRLIERKCLICSDRATGINYGILSCDSCKVFFHRNASRPIEKLECFFSGNCTIDKTNRKYCSRCRLEKCFASGMRLKPQLDNSDRPTTATESAIQKRIEFCLELSLLRRHTKVDQQNLTQYLTAPAKHYELSSYEKDIIFEIQNANRSFPDEKQAKIVKIASCDADCEALISHFQAYITRTMQFCHGIPAFNSLTSNDQLRLLKQFIYSMLGIRFSYSVDLDRNGQLMITNNEGTEAVLIDGNGKYSNSEKVQVLRSFAKALHHEMDNDHIIRDLLSVMLLFDAPGSVSCYEFVRYQHLLYSRLLFRYLEHKFHSRQEANTKFTSLMQILSYKDAAKENKRFILQATESRHQSPIMMELLNVTE